eukprot:scpid88519/ scgid35311/ 
MAPTPKEAAAQDPSRLEHFASKFCRQRTPVASRATQRRPGAEINTPLRWRIVTEYQNLLGDRSRVPPGGLKSLQSLFPGQNFSKRTIQKLAQQQQRVVQYTDVSRSRPGCGDRQIKIAEEIAEKLIEINSHPWSHLSREKPAGKLKQTKSGYGAWMVRSSRSRETSPLHQAYAIESSVSSPVTVH